jgi:hypothetical protein
VSRGVGIGSMLLSMSLLMRMWSLRWWEMADGSGFEVVARADEVGHGGVWLHRTARRHVGLRTAPRNYCLTLETSTTTFAAARFQPRGAPSQSSPTDYLLLREGCSETSEADAVVVKQVQLFVLKASRLITREYESTSAVENADLRCKGQQ